MAKGQNIGYARVSSASQHLDRQLVELEQHATDRIFFRHGVRKEHGETGLRRDDALLARGRRTHRLQHGSPVTQPDGPTGYHRKTAATRGAGVFLKEGIRLEPKGNADPMTELVFAMIGSNCAVRALAHPQAAA